MKIQYSLILLGLLFSVQSFALRIAPDRFNGSALCGDLSITYTLPDTLQGKYQYFVQVTKDQVNNELIVSYDFVSSPNADFVDAVTIDLTSYFNGGILFNESIFWTVVESVSIDGAQVISNQVGHGTPYAWCEETKVTCEKITVYRKRVQEICPISYIEIRPSFEIIGNTIDYSFGDTTIQASATCLAIGYTTITDSIEITGMEAKLYSIREKSRGFIICDPLGPCTQTYNYKFIGEADLHNCIINGVENEIALSGLYPTLIERGFTISGFEGVVRLTNQQGQQYEINGNEQFDVSSLPRGMYIVSFTREGKEVKEKVILQ